MVCSLYLNKYELEKVNAGEVCPYCGSTDLFIDVMNPHILVTMDVMNVILESFMIYLES